MNRAEAICEVLYATAARSSDVLELRAVGGEKLSTERRAELLAQAVAREHVEVELDLVAYEQVAGEMNRNGVRFRDGAMTSLGRSGKGTPFLRDHLQRDATARGGVIVRSETKKLGDGAYRIEQTVKLTDPGAVERALRGLMSSVSIGALPTGPILCSACNAEIFSGCWHFPFDVVKADGKPDHVVEWIYTAGELVETSEVSVPAVPRARIESVRAAVMAAGGVNRGDLPLGVSMNKLALLATMLGLAATASEDEALRAVDSLKERLKLTEQQRDDHAATAVAATAKLAAFEQLATRQAEDAFIADGIKAGKIIPGAPFEAALRTYYGKDAEGARALLASSPTVTPVGEPRQSDKPAPAGPALGVEAASQTIAAHGGTPDGVRAVLAKLGVSNPDAAIAKHLTQKGA